MATRVMNIESLNFTIQTLRALIGAEDDFTWAPGYQVWCIKSPSGLAQALGKLGSKPLIIMDPTGGIQITEDQAYKAEGILHYKSCSIHIITGKYNVEETEYVKMVVSTLVLREIL